MKHRFLVSLVMLAGVGGLAPNLVAAGQAPAATATSAAATKMNASPTATRRTAWGDPDLQGVWTNHHQVPLQRPDQFAGRELLTDEEAAALEKQAAANRDRPPAKGQVGAYNAFWSERLQRSRRTSQIVDPPDGKLPPLTHAWKIVVEDAIKRRSVGQSYADRDPFERCITRGMPGTMMPGFYNHIYQILQTPEYVVIHTEMIHDARIIPLDKRPHLPSSVQQWMGDSRGHWEGGTLVVETTNFNGGMTNAYQFSYGVGQGARITERFTATDVNTIDYKYTVDDPARSTKPWTAVSPLEKFDEGFFEYACHEGNNYSTENSLAGVRAKQKSPEVVAREIQEHTRSLQTR